MDFATSDYTETSGWLTFLVGETLQTVTVPVIADTLIEPDETVTLTLSNPANATLGTPSSATGTITNDD